MGLLTDLIGINENPLGGSGGFDFSSVLSPGSTDPAFAEMVKLLEALGLNSNPNEPRHYYDYESALAGGAKLGIDPASGGLHWPSEFKTFGHPTYANKFDPSAPVTPGPMTDPNDSIEDFIAKLAGMYRSREALGLDPSLGL